MPMKLAFAVAAPLILAVAANEPVKEDAAAEQAAAAAHSVVDRASRCFMQNMGTRGGYDSCTGSMCAVQCANNAGGCAQLCTSQSAALFQKFTEKAQPKSFLATVRQSAPEDELAKEMTHDLEMNFNKIAPFGKEDTAKELQDHAASCRTTLVDAVENAEVAEIKRAVFRALTRLRAATIKEFDTIARLETRAIDAYNDAHHYRSENPLTHLHEDEAPVETDKLKSFH